MGVWQGTGPGDRGRQRQTKAAESKEERQKPCRDEGGRQRERGRENAQRKRRGEAAWGWEGLDLGRR